jgi:hypothetical protein
MAGTSISILLELDGTTEHPAGRASLPDGTGRTFHGWLGLAEAIDSLVAVSVATPEMSGGPRRGDIDHSDSPSSDGRRENNTCSGAH